MTGITQCEDFMLFQRALKQYRELDDKIIYALNMSTPTASMVARGANAQQSCQTLQTEFQANAKFREESLSSCISVLSTKIKEMKKEGDSQAFNLRPVQNSLRLMRTELNVEEIIRERTQNMFNNKCKEYMI